MADLVAAIEVHLLLAFAGLLLGLVIGLLLALVALTSRPLARGAYALTGITQVVPALALAALVVPILGIGFLPALVVVAVSTLLPIARTTYLGLMSPSAAELDAARGIGLTPLETLRFVRIPAGMPAFFSGFRLAAVIANSVAVMTVFIGSGGLGSVVLEGLSRFYFIQVFEGALPAIALALINDRILTHLESRLVPPAFRASTEIERGDPGG